MAKDKIEILMKTVKDTPTFSNPKPVDLHVGNRLRMRRTLLGLSQEKLGEAIGLTFQQVQKYERGLNRIGASRLWDISKILDVPISFFFEDMDNTASIKHQIPYVPGLAEDKAPFNYDPMSKKETIELVRAFYSIKDPAVAKKVLDLLKTLAGNKTRRKKV